ncbi:MAG: CHASE2 domain-containing protein, partial [Rivularia sp. (in: cyanobacteria)]
MKKLFKQPGIQAIASSVVVTGLLVVGQNFGFFQILELRVFDWMMQITANSEPDSRLLIVGVNEEDIKEFKQVPLSDEVINDLLGKLIKYKPRAIGLDNYRDIAINPGHDKLLKTLKQDEENDDLIVPICKHPPDSTTPGISPPKGIENPDLKVGFSDVVEDTDGVIRRNLLLSQESNDCP